MARQIFLLTSNSLTAWQQEGRHLVHMACFVAAEAGLADFDVYLQRVGQLPAMVLTDMVEEDFRIDSVAHAHGGDRAALLERHVARLYRGTTYRRASVLGRDPHNRRKDQALFSGLLNPEFADMWLDAMRHHKIPIVGMYSLPLQSRDLMKRLWDKNSDVLFVTHNATSGLRQSFFVGGQLRFSRLTPDTDETVENYAAFVRAEIGKTKRYLANLHLLGRDVVLDVCMISGGERLANLELLRDTEALTHYQFIDIDDAARKSGLRDLSDDYRCDELYVSLLSRMHPKNHYASPDQRFHYHVYRARQALGALSVVAVVMGVLWSGSTIIDGLLYRQQADRISELLVQAGERQEALEARLPRTDVAPEDIRAAVSTANRLRELRRDPKVLLARLGRELQHQPGLHLDRIEWFVSNNRSAISPDSIHDQDVLLEPEYDEDGNPLESELVSSGAYYQIGVLSGRIDSFEGDFSQAHAHIERLLSALRSRPGVAVAEALSLPFNTDSSGRVLGGIGDVESKQEAEFRLRLVMGEIDA